jgi:endonuclease YncB( thermonuclease family)
MGVLDDVVDFFLGEDDKKKEKPSPTATRFALELFDPAKGFRTVSEDIDRGGEMKVAIPKMFSGFSAYAKTPGGISTLINPGSDTAWGKMLKHYYGAYGHHEHKFDNVVLQSAYQEHIRGTAQLIDTMMDEDTREYMTEDPDWWIPFLGKLFQYTPTAEIEATKGIGKVFVPRFDKYKRPVNTILEQLLKAGIDTEVFGGYWDSREPKARGEPYDTIDLGKTVADQSLVSRATYGEFSVLFLGNAGHKLQARLAELGGDSLKSTILVVPPGFQDNMNKELMAKINPAAIIQAGSRGITPEESRFTSVDKPFGDIPVYNVSTFGALQLTTTGYDKWDIDFDPHAPGPPMTSAYPFANPRIYFGEGVDPDWIPEDSPQTFRPIPGQPGRFWAKVRKVVDADSYILEGMPQETRVLRVDAPETHTTGLPLDYFRIPGFGGNLFNAWFFGEDFRDEYERTVGFPSLKGKPAPFAEVGKLEIERLILDRDIVIEFDEEKVDMYGRALIYAFTPDGIFLNEHLLEMGYAINYSPGKAIRYPWLRGVGEKAERDKKGLWGQPGGKDASFPPSLPKKEQKQSKEREQSALDSELGDIAMRIDLTPLEDYGLTPIENDIFMSFPA